MPAMTDESGADPRVDAYLAKLPTDQQDVLGKVRARVRSIEPEAQETISYGMPAFTLDGHFLLSYAGWKRHCSIYPIDDALLARYAAELGGYIRTKGSLHFSGSEPLPDALLEDLVRGRVMGVREGPAERRGGPGY
jgi:uncharacterized protein YdhG (YjbR/CyaY superfamily)